MLAALCAQNLLFSLRPGSVGRNGGLFAIQKILEKCGLIVNLITVSRAMRGKPQMFWLPSVEVLAHLGHVA